MLNEKVTRLRSRAVSIIFAVVLGLGFAISAQGQAANKSPERGFHAGGSYALSEIETISRSSGELSLNIPLGSLPSGRGGLSASLRMLYSSKIWDTAEGVDSTDIINPVDYSQLIKAEEGEGNWRYGYAYRLKLRYKKLGSLEGYCDGINEHPYQLVLVTPDGGQHTLRLEEQYYNAHVDGDGYMDIYPDGRRACFSQEISGPITYYTTDGSYLRLDIQPDTDTNWENNSWTLSMPDGTRVFGGTVPGSTAFQRIQDRNGNFIDIENSTYNGHPATYIKDQMNRAIILEIFSTSQDKIHVTGANGIELVWIVQWRDIMVRKRFHKSDREPAHLLNTVFRVVDKIFLPTQITGNLNYTFDYNANACDPFVSNCNPDSNPTLGWGELKSIILPSGATAAYEYKQDNTSGTIGSPLYPFWILRDRPKKKTLTYSTDYDGVPEAHSEVWLYDVLYSGNNGASVDEVVTQTTTTAPDGGISYEYAQRTASGPYIAEETAKTVNPDGSVVERIYNYNPPPGAPTLVMPNRFVKYEFTSVTNQAQTQLTKTAIKEYSYDLNGNVLVVKEYDWVNYGDVPRDAYGQPTGLPVSTPTPVRVTVKDYHLPASGGNLYSVPGSPLLRNAVKSSETQNGSGTAFSRSEFTYDSFTTTGNLTIQKSWDSRKGGVDRPYSNPLTTTNSISATTSYSSSGNVLTTTDAKGVITTMTYAAINGHTDLYPTKIEKASNYATLKLTTDKVYDFTSGLETEVKDVDNDVKTTMTYDPFGRPTQVIAAADKPEASRSVTEYYDADRRVVSRSDFASFGDGKLVSIKHYDQLGRVRLSRSLEDAAESTTDETKGIKVQMRYLFSGAFSYTLSSNPYRTTADETMGWSRSKTDKGGRLIEVESFSGASLPFPWGSNTTSTGKVLTSYDANTTTVTDQATKQRRSLIDGLGRLIRVDEPTTAGLGDITSPNQKTDYTYDALNNLIRVQQGSQQNRYFLYDSLQRLTRAFNPEQDANTNLPALTDPLTGNTQWNSKYTYDENSNLKTKVEARNITTTYTYDELNRVKTRIYTNDPANTPTVTYTYDAAGVAFSKGRLTQVTNSVSTTDYLEFDRLGKVKQSKQTTQTPEGAKQYAFSYDFNISGALTKETYPSNKAIVTEYDAVGRVAGIKKDGGAYYAGATPTDTTNRISYTAHGAVKALKLGNGLWEHTNYNARLQPLQIGLGTTSMASGTLQLNYTYGSTNNNGNVLSQQIVVGTMDVTQTYTYDEVNRLQTATEKLTATPFTQYWKQVFTYDRFGNRQFDSNQTIPSEVLGAALSFDLTNNRITTSGYVYDLAGNVTQEPNGKSYTYDAENHQRTFTASGTTNYEYDGDGRRVKKSDTTGTLVYVYNAMGKLAAEYTTAAPLNNGISYLTTDHLGSTRVVTGKDASGTPTVKARYDFLPFGEETPTTLGGRGSAGYISDNTKQKFTGHERDAESKLDFAQARYCSSAIGRFMSVDPAMQGAYKGEPQSFNAYAYALNNPIAIIDPTGETWVTAGGRLYWTDADITTQEARKLYGKTAQVLTPGTRWVFTSGSLAGQEVILNKNRSATYVGPYQAPAGADYFKLGNNYGGKAAAAFMFTTVKIGLLAGTAGLSSGGLLLLAVIGEAANEHKQQQEMLAVGRIDTESETSNGALREAKRVNRVPESAQPDKTILPGTPEGEAAGLRPNDNVKLYEYTNSEGQKIQIRQDRAVTYPDGKTQDPHYNSGIKGPKLRNHHFFIRR